MIVIIYQQGLLINLQCSTATFCKYNVELSLLPISLNTSFIL